jgi:molybdopterin-guanine dinucleotide biosynthesis protein A
VGSAATLQAYGAVVEDVFPGRGPLGGIHAALCATATDLNLLLAVDLPFVSSALLEYLAAQARDTDAVVTVPRFAEGWQPLCAVYRKEFAKAAGEALRSGRNAVHSLLEREPCRVLDEAELLQAGFSRALFRNLNTVQDLANFA